MTDKDIFSKTINIKVKSVITDLTDDKQDKETMEFSADGTLTLKGSTVELMYRETFSSKSCHFQILLYHPLHGFIGYAIFSST